MKAKIANLLIVLITLVPVLLASACNGTGATSQQSIPVANITSPASGTTLTLGQEFLVTFNAADVKGIAQIELSINEEPVMVETVDPPVNSYTASYRWKTSAVGSHIIELRAFNVDQETGDANQVFVTVAEGEATATATLVPTVEEAPTPTLAPALDTATPVPPTPAPTNTVAPTVTSEPIVTPLVGLRLRAGPGTDYAVLGQVEAGEAMRITGRSENSAWWQVEYPSVPGGRAWLAAGSEFSTASNAGEVPVVPAPPLEVVAAPTPVPPTNTPTLLKPTIFSFTANRYTIALGESAELSWDLANAQVALLRYDDKEEGVVAPGRKTVNPEKSTKYVLVARNEAGETTAELTILVGGATATPVPVYRDGKIRIANNQFIDFDQGLVSSDSDNEMDFRWQAEIQEFRPQNGATGTLLSRSYGDIRLTDCLDAPYGTPISGIDGSSQITGCYITSNDRYGKFFISEWDAAGNLTIEWLTWDYRR